MFIYFQLFLYQYVKTSIQIPISVCKQMSRKKNCAQPLNSNNHRNYIVCVVQKNLCLDFLCTCSILNTKSKRFKTLDCNLNNT